MSFFVRYVVILGGNWSNGGYTGPRYRNFNNSASTANANIGSRGQRCIGVRPLTAELITLSLAGRTLNTRLRLVLEATISPLLVGYTSKIRGFLL